MGSEQTKPPEKASLLKGFLFAVDCNSRAAGFILQLSTALTRRQRHQMLKLVVLSAFRTKKGALRDLKAGNKEKEKFCTAKGI